MDASAHPEDASAPLIHLVLTSPVVMGIVAWTSLLITVAGFSIALYQIWKIRSSTEAARLAAIKATRAVHGREHTAKINEALSHMRLAMVHMHSNPGAAGAYIDTVCNSLVDAHHVSGAAPDYEMLAHILRLRDDFRYIQGLGEQPGAAVRLRRISTNLHNAVTASETLVARLRYHLGLDEELDQ